MPEAGHRTELTRRRMLQGAGVALTAAVGTAVIGLAGPGGTPAAAAGPGGGDTFDELYKGRRIQGRPASGGGHHHGSDYTVLIDGEELHVMRNADGTWISVVNHYQPHQTPRALARAAVVELQGAALVPIA
ncbi:tyrosinase cofactor [Kitasatospora sp. NPDC051914]|uniref:apotyrosinase chaperone MelC1 n=1 Tax=Kitasatospora sp. NPDC051914 TaxID=3154945 RepID=UPI00342B8F7D